MTNRTTAIWQDNRAIHYGQGRRRWVPKGVMLLAVLFVVGLLSACQTPPPRVAAIAVPAELSVRCPVTGVTTSNVQGCSRPGANTVPALPVLSRSDSQGEEVADLRAPGSIAPGRIARLSMF